MIESTLQLLDECFEKRKIQHNNSVSTLKHMMTSFPETYTENVLNALDILYSTPYKKKLDNIKSFCYTLVSQNRQCFSEISINTNFQLPCEKTHLDDLRSRVASVFKEVEELSLELQRKKAHDNAAVACETICNEISSLRDQLTDMDVATSKIVSSNESFGRETISKDYNHVMDSVYNELKENQVSIKRPSSTNDILRPIEIPLQFPHEIQEKQLTVKPIRNDDKGRMSYTMNDESADLDNFVLKRRKEKKYRGHNIVLIADNPFHSLSFDENEKKNKE